MVKICFVNFYRDFNSEVVNSTITYRVDWRIFYAVIETFESDSTRFEQSQAFVSRLST